MVTTSVSSVKMEFICSHHDFQNAIISSEYVDFWTKIWLILTVCTVDFQTVDYQCKKSTFSRKVTVNKNQMLLNKTCSCLRLKGKHNYLYFLIRIIHLLTRFGYLLGNPSFKHEIFNNLTGVLFESCASLNLKPNFSSNNSQLVGLL